MAETLHDPAGRPNDQVQVGQGNPDEYEDAKSSGSGGLGGMKVADLKSLADERGVEYDSKASKADLVAALEAAEESEEPSGDE